MKRSPSKRDSRCRPTAGFTLIEVIIALTLVGLVSLIILHGVGLAAFGLERLSQRSAQLDERRSLEMLMRRALAVPVADDVSDGEPTFIGRPTSLSFHSVIDDGGPGIYRIDLKLTRHASEAAVSVSRCLAGRSILARCSESVLIHGVRQLAITYFGATSPAEDPSWHKSWQRVEHLPQLVRITLDTGGARPEPPIILRLGDAG